MSDMCRTDEGDVRKNTAKNLEAVGYGMACSDPRLRVGGQDDGPCYVELGMRMPDERDLLASVYKPKQRRRLQVGIHSKLLGIQPLCFFSARRRCRR